MKSSYSIFIDHELKIIRYVHSGTIKDKSEIGEVWEKLLDLKEFSELGYYLFSDYRKAVIKLPESDIEFIYEYFVKIKNILEFKKQSIVIEEPTSTALSVLFMNQIQETTNFRIKIFSTEEAAIKWLRE